MYETKYHKASSADEAARLLAAAEDGKFLSGGQTLLPTMKQRLAAPTDLVDLSQIDAMKGITIDGKKITIGAVTTHAEVASSSELRDVCHSICDLAGMIGDPHVRNMGTIGGSIANNDPAADYPAAMMSLNAEIMTTKRTIAADDFFVDLFETALEDDEIITAISYTVPSKCGYAKFPHPASRYAMTGVFVSKNVDGTVRVGVTGAGASGVFRHEGMESALAGTWTADALKDCTVDANAMLSDIHADGAYRANLVKVLAGRAVASSC